MKSEDKNFETIKSKILKLHALAERGEQGEAANARRLLEKLLNSYGLTLEQILAEKEEKHWFKFKATKKWEKKLCFQCYYKVMNVSTLSYKEYKGYICYELTAYEFAEIQNLFEWHKAQLGKELKQLLEDFTESYCIKHSITSDCSRDDDAEAKPLSPQERQRLLKIMMLVDTVEDTSYRKMIE